MSHGITERDGVFSVREPMWHGLGTILGDYPTREEAQRLVHNWEPVQETLYRRTYGMASPFDPLPEPVFEEVEGSVLNVRSDNGYPLGVVNDTYQPVTNTELWDIAELLQGEGADVKFETAGSLLGGKKVWVLLRLNEPLTLAGDPNGATIPYYGLQNSHDGSGALRGQSLMTRIVCDNTSQIADSEAQSRGTEFVFRHTKNVRDRVNEAAEALAGWRESVVTWNRFQEHLLTLPVNGSQRQLYLEKFIPAPPPHTASDRVMGNVESARQMIRDILDSPTCEGVDNTAYGLVQASVEYLNHYRSARTNQSRFKRTFLDRNVLVSDATTLALEVAGV